MMIFEREVEPEKFTNDNNIIDAKHEVRSLYEGALGRFRHKRDGINFPKTISPRPGNRKPRKCDFWKNYKSDFSRMQHGRCGYCEQHIISTQPSDVEHYKPKGHVSSLDPNNAGREVDYLSRVRDRKELLDQHIGTGYWWDAFEWDNYLLACRICNSGWKRNFFPIEGDPTLRTRPTRNVLENPLILNPFEEVDLSKHIGIDIKDRENAVGTVTGFLRGKTPRGIATIETIGLNRPSLIRVRQLAIQRVNDWITELNQGSAEVVRLRTIDIFKEGSPAGSGLFPGLTQIFFKQITGMEWTELQTLVEID